MMPGDELVEGDRADAEGRTGPATLTASDPLGTADRRPASPLRDLVRQDVRAASGAWWWYLVLGIGWVWYGAFVLSYRVGSLAAVAGLVGAAFLFGGVGQLMAAGRATSWRPLFVVTGILALGAGIVTFVWPDITLYVVSIVVAWYLVVFGVVRLVGALAGPKRPWWWTQLVLGGGELVLGVWSMRSWQHSLLTLVTLVGAWAIAVGVGELFAAFSLRELSRPWNGRAIDGDRATRTRSAPSGAPPPPDGWAAEADGLDLAVYAAIAETPTPRLDRVFRRLSRAADGSVLWIATAAVLAALGGERGRRAAVHGLASIGVTSAVVNLLLKRLARRRRPDRATHGVPVARHVTMPVTTSFPSGHAASASAFATGVATVSPEAGILVSAAAALVAYSRVHTGVHYPGDVIVGTVTGASLAPITAAALTRIHTRRNGR